MPAIVNKLKNVKHRLFPKEVPLPFPDTLNIESSYHCNLKCVMCPRHFDSELQGMFPIELFREKVVPVLGRFKWVHLTGWGEPLMNKHLVEMLELCKEAGTWVCFTSNGLLLKEPLSRRVVDSGVDMIDISCDASQPDTYEKVRGKGTFDVLMKRWEHMVHLRETVRPEMRLEWAYVMMKSNIHELPGAVKRAVEHGADRFHAKHMESSIDRADMAEAMWNTGFAPDLTPEWQQKLDDVLEESRKIAEGTRTELVIHPQKYFREGQCHVRPANNIFIDYRGNVSSCCYLNKLDVKRYLNKDERPNDDGVMGNIGLVDFVNILDQDRYKGFRQEWVDGKVPEACRNCVNIARMDDQAIGSAD